MDEEKRFSLNTNTLTCAFVAQFMYVQIGNFILHSKFENIHKISLLKAREKKINLAKC